MSWYVPQVFERTGQSERIYDLYSRLLKDRIIFLQSEINDMIANTVVSQLLFLEADDPDKDIFLYINSPGGSVTAGLAIYDTIQYINSDVQTICLGQAGSMAAVILAAGTNQKRFALPHSRIIIHQPLGGATGQATDIEIQANEMIRIRDVINDILVEHTGQPKNKISVDVDRDFFMTAEQAKEYGVIDEVFKQKKQIDA